MKALIMTLALVGFVGSVHADETVKEKAQATTNDATRSVKKGVHRVEEAVCTEGDAKCLAKKAEHRAQEAGDYTKDKASEIKNDVDKK
ncbi:MAG: hypothetical protein JWM78_258 [Verrucomicrobiaceae bacterium]|nr:hypothetical protein [Verrucomicrobiaceae bacterium]